MAVFAYDPNAVKTWADEVINYLNGGSDSVSICSKKFSEQIEKLVQPNVWTGSAAKQNYQNFMETHNALIKFINEFGLAFQDAMNSVNKSVGNLEEANLGSASVTGSFGSLNYNQISQLSEENINIDVIRYDYATISEIGNVLNQINSSLENVNERLKSKINVLNDGNSIWDGDAAERARENLNNILTQNMTSIFGLLKKCIEKISEAAQLAQTADRG